MVKTVANLVLKLLIGLVGGLLAWFVGLPMPFMIGSLLITAVFVLMRSEAAQQGPGFPRIVRQSFTAIIGVMIGQSFSPELLGQLDSLWLSMAMIVPFVLLAHGVGYVVYRHLGDYDRDTAVYASVPGGLIEAITFAEQAGARVGIVTVQHFARVVLVITIVPLLFFFWTGKVVGSASGVELAEQGYSYFDVVVTLGVAALGMILGKRLRLPAAILIGPLVLSAGLQLTGVMPAHAPTWLLNTAQLVIGVGLGSEFQGISRSQLVKSLGLGLIAMVAYLGIAFGFAHLLEPHLPVGFSALFLSYAPGGVTEMSLVALSLGIGPIVVAAHHVFRISVTVVVMVLLSKRLIRDPGAG